MDLMAGFVMIVRDAVALLSEQDKPMEPGEGNRNIHASGHRTARK